MKVPKPSPLLGKPLLTRLATPNLFKLLDRLNKSPEFRALARQALNRMPKHR
jgi:hypothetical protein